MIDFNNENIIYNKKNGLEYIQFKKLLEYGIKHAYTLKGENINFRSNSVEQEKCYKKLFDSLELNINTLIKPLQNHTSNVKCISKIIPKAELKDIDGLITDKSNIALATTNADCILMLIYDPIKKVIANIHSGWKGTFQKIAEKTIVKMQTHYKCEPKDIIICMTPSIHKCHFEVGEDVKDLCEEIFGFTGRTQEFISKGKIKDGIQRYFIDTILINKILLMNLGVKDENIIDSEICSVCHSNKINSYRIEGKDYKLATSLISL